jgi:hypothetical protein
LITAKNKKQRAMDLEEHIARLKQILFQEQHH